MLWVSTEGSNTPFHFEPKSGDKVGINARTHAHTHTHTHTHTIMFRQVEDITVYSGILCKPIRKLRSPAIVPDYVIMHCVSCSCLYGM